MYYHNIITETEFKQSHVPLWLLGKVATAAPYRGFVQGERG